MTCARCGHSEDHHRSRSSEDVQHTACHFIGGSACNCPGFVDASEKIDDESSDS